MYQIKNFWNSSINLDFKFIVLQNEKLLKPPLSLLSTLERVLLASYFDDLITMDCSYSARSKNIMKIINPFMTTVSLCGP